MKRSILNISDFILGSSKVFAASIFFFIIGISVGVFTELMMSQGEKDTAISYFNQYFLVDKMTQSDYTDIFLRSAGSNLGLLLIIVLSCLTAIGFPLAIAALSYKGAALGFSAALLIESLSFKGISYIFTSMIPQNILLIPAFIVATVISLNLAFYLLSQRKIGIKKSLADCAGPYTFLNVILALIIIVGCIIESFICPFLTQLIG